jgi:L-ascorbate metabolism protein UlaG (beta-lactamase superfamily)
MTQIRRLTDSCLIVTTDDDDTFLDGEIDLESIGDVTRVFVTHEHGDHVHPDFLKWLIDRKSDLVVYSNQAVAELLDAHDIGVSVEVPADSGVEDVLHEKLPNGAQPPNRSFTIDGVITHPGDSHQPTVTAPTLALPMITPWGSVTAAVDFARRLGPERVLMIHDFYLSASGRSRIRHLAKGAFDAAGIELLDVDWGQSFTV